MTAKSNGILAPDGSEYITLTDGAGNLVSIGTGTGTVTSASVTTANGVSGTVATATTTPAISLTLGAITPTTVNKVAITAPATSATLTIADGKTLTWPGAFNHLLVNGAVAGNVTVSGITTGSTLLEVLHHVYTAGVLTNITDLTSEFTITATNTINNTGGTSSNTNKLMVRWVT